MDASKRLANEEIEANKLKRHQIREKNAVRAKYKIMKDLHNPRFVAMARGLFSDNRPQKIAKY